MSRTSAIYISCLVLATAVVLGAFGAHALRDQLSEQSLANWNTGVSYQFYHGIGILLLTTIYLSRPNKWLGRSIILMLTGIICFSGSLYLLSTMSWTFLGPVTPIGGLAFILGWLAAIPGLKMTIEYA